MWLDCKEQQTIAERIGVSEATITGVGWGSWDFPHSMLAFGRHDDD
jgi:hypothetical protein